MLLKVQKNTVNQTSEANIEVGLFSVWMTVEFPAFFLMIVINHLPVLNVCREGETVCVSTWACAHDYEKIPFIIDSMQLPLFDAFHKHDLFIKWYIT